MYLRFMIPAYHHDCPTHAYVTELLMLTLVLIMYLTYSCTKWPILPVFHSVKLECGLELCGDLYKGQAIVKTR